MAEIEIFENIMKRNDAIAGQNRKLIGNALSINIMSSPGAGKTTILERTLEILKNKLKIGIIEGDIATSEDASRLKKYKIAVHQIKTENYGGGCHLDARMVNNALKRIKNKNKKYDFIIIENVGNLICPADFYLGEDKKTVVLSVTEGDEKPLKYPLMFELADVMILNKIDLLPYVDFSVEKLKANVKKINKKLKVIEMSAKEDINVDVWTKQLKKWLKEKLRKSKRG